jgi:hypothetical protein
MGMRMEVMMRTLKMRTILEWKSFNMIQSLTRKKGGRQWTEVRILQGQVSYRRENQAPKEAVAVVKGVLLGQVCFSLMRRTPSC